LKIVGCALLLAGSFLIISALVLLSTVWLRLLFTLAALIVEGIGLALLLKSHIGAEVNRP